MGEEPGDGAVALCGGVEGEDGLDQEGEAVAIGDTGAGAVIEQELSRFGLGAFGGLADDAYNAVAESGDGCAFFHEKANAGFATRAGGGVDRFAAGAAGADAEGKEIADGFDIAFVGSRSHQGVIRFGTVGGEEFEDRRGSGGSDSHVHGGDAALIFRRGVGALFEEQAGLWQIDGGVHEGGGAGLVGGVHGGAGIEEKPHHGDVGFEDCVHESRGACAVRRIRVAAGGEEFPGAGMIAVADGGQDIAGGIGEQKSAAEQQGERGGDGCALRVKAGARDHQPNYMRDWASFARGAEGRRAMIGTMVRRGCGIILMALVAWPAAAAGEWIRMSAPGLELYTKAGPKQARDLLLRLEEVRSFFLKASPVRQLSDGALRIVEFPDRDEFLKYSPKQIAAAYFTNGPDRDYIVLGPEAQNNFGIVVHEYMHLIVKHSGLRLPVWLNEGWADVYSTLRPQGKDTAVGDLIPGRMESLTKDEWLDFNTLTTVTTSSPIYNEGARAGIFYAESWALAHMLYLAPDYQANFAKFVYELHAGRTTGEACQTAFGRSGEQVFADLQNYFRRKKILGRVYETRNEKAQEEPRESAISEFDKGLVLADLLAVDGKAEEAKIEFERLDREKPGRADVLRALGDLAKVRRDDDATRAYYEKAFDAGEQNAAMCFDVAVLEQRKGQLARAVTMLERAVKVKPGYTEAAVLLGLTQMDVRNFEGAITTLLAISEIRPEAAPAVFCGLAVSYVQTGNFEAAREHLATCRKWSKTDDQLKRAGQVSAFIEARAKPEAAVRKGEKRGGITGTALGVDCTATGTRLRVQVSGKVASFDLPMSAAVELTPAHGGQLKLQCGPMAPVRVGVEFAPPLTAIGTSSGIVRRLEF